MSSGARSSRHVYRPAAVIPLERRDVPSAASARSDFRDFRATVVGGIPHTRDGTSMFFINHGKGKTSDGRPIGMYGFLSTTSTGVPGDPPMERGVAFLNVKGHEYGLSLNGAGSNQEASPGLANLSIAAISVHPRTLPHGRPFGQLVGQGTMQLHRMSGPGGAETFTATLIISPTTPVTFQF